MVLSLAAAGVVGLGGCSLFTTMWGPPSGFVAPGARPRSPTGLMDLKGVVHCHGFLSHDSVGTVEEIAAAADSVGMDFVIMTDHQTPHSVSRGRRGMVGDTLFIVGAEIRVPGGTLLAFPLRHYVRPYETLAEHIEDIRGQGGLAFVGHAERFTAWDEIGALDGIEIHNLHAAAKAASKAALILDTLFMPLSVMFGSLAEPDRDVFANWDEHNRRRPLPVVGGNDAHANIRLLGPLGWVLGSYTEVFRVLSTHVLAESLDEAAIVDAVRAGRTFVVIDLWRDGSGFAFWAEDAWGVHEMGSTVATDATLRVRSPADAEIRLLRHGVVVDTRRGREAFFSLLQAGVHRVEVWLDGEPWIFSSPIRVR